MVTSRIWFTAAQKAELWERWKNGQSAAAISRALAETMTISNCLRGRRRPSEDRRIADKQTLIEEIAAWEHDRNANHTKADWQFTTQSARVKLKYLYPSI